MNEQCLDKARYEGSKPGAESHDVADDASRVAVAGGELDRIYAATAPILDKIRSDNSERFLEQARQTDGE